MGLKYNVTQGNWNWKRDGRQTGTVQGADEWMENHPVSSPVNSNRLFGCLNIEKKMFSAQGGMKFRIICELWV